MHVWGEALVLDSFTLQVGGDFGEQGLMLFPHLAMLCSTDPLFWQQAMH